MASRSNSAQCQFSAVLPGLERASKYQTSKKMEEMGDAKDY